MVRYASERDTDPMLGQCWATVCEAGITLTLHWFNVSRLLGHHVFSQCLIRNGHKKVNTKLILVFAYIRAFVFRSFRLLQSLYILKGSYLAKILLASLWDR